MFLHRVASIASKLQISWQFSKHTYTFLACKRAILNMEIKPIVQLPISSCIDNYKSLPEPIPVIPPTGLLLLKSIKRLSPPVDGSLVSVYLQIAGEIMPNSPYTLNSNNEALLNIERCLQNSLTLSLSQEIDLGTREFVNEQIVSITDFPSFPPLQFLGINSVNYTFFYEIIPGQCTPTL